MPTFNRVLAGLFFLFSAFSALAQTGGEIRGTVKDALNNEPLPGAIVRVTGTSLGAATDLDGNYVIRNVPPGLYNLRAEFVDYKPGEKFEITVSLSRIAEVDFALEQEGPCLGCDSIIITASPFNKTVESPLSIRTIGVNEIQRNPGGNRDISKVIQSLPGVAASVSFRNDIIIRGGAPNENRFYLDGIEVPNINHFSTQGASGGPVGMINVDFIREVDFLSGAFPASRGNMISSLMEIKLKEGKSDKLGFRGTVGSSDLALSGEGPIGKKTTFIAGARRSYLQGLFSILGLPFLPTYNDFQFKIQHTFNNKNKLTILGLGAYDVSRLNLAADSTDEQRYILGYLPELRQWNYTVGMKFTHFTDDGSWSFILSRNMLDNRSFKYADNDDSDEANLIQDYRSQEMENKARWETTRRINAWRISYGVNYEYTRYTNSTFNRISLPGEITTINFGTGLDLHKYGAFAQAGRSFLKERLLLSAGLRTDGNTFNDEMANPLTQLSPRVSATFGITKKINANFNTGIFHQLPAYTVMGYIDEWGQRINKLNNLTYITNKQVVGGLEYNYQESGKITVESFYKRYSKYPFLLRDSISLANLGGDFGVIGNEPVTSTSDGRAYGLEFMVQQKLWKGFYGILAYTLVRSEFTDGSGQFRPSAWDNRHIVTFTGGKKFNKNWEVGLRWRFYGGTPYTPIDLDRSSQIAVWDVTGRGLPDYGLLNTQRLNPAHQLDLRVDKKWFFKKWSLNLYLDVQNAYAFKAQLAPYLDVERDANGNPVPDPDKPGYYKVRLLPNETGTVLPTLGVVVEFN